MRFIDTNIILRHLTNDDKTKAVACRALFERLRQGSEQATCTEATITEVAYILSARGHYDLHPMEIRARLAPILGLRGLRLPNKRLYLRALDLYATYPSLDFEDVLTIAYMERARVTELYSYDKDFDAVPGVTRVEPAPP